MPSIKQTSMTLFLLIATVITATGGVLKKEVRLAGKTMGTRWRVKVVAGYFDDTQKLDSAIQKRLLAINRSMSLYDKESELCEFNALPSTEKFRVSDDFMAVFRIGKKLYAETGGAWDATIRPLVNLWGFGDTAEDKKVPDASDIEKRLAHVSFNSVNILDTHFLVKTDPAVTLDFGSIAKGFGVDQLAALIKQNGYSNFIVEIGGEVYASGKRKDGDGWRIGINMPDKNAPFNEVYKVVTVDDQAVATSGDYRNFFEKQHKTYSHVIDPRTGRPVNNGVASASVIADSCTYADGLATALMVMGHEKGIDLVNRTRNVECLIIVRNQDGTLANYFSRHFHEERQQN